MDSRTAHCHPFPEFFLLVITYCHRLCHSSSHMCTGSSLDCPCQDPDLFNSKIEGLEHLTLGGWAEGTTWTKALSQENVGTLSHVNEPGQRRGRRSMSYSSTKFSPVSSPWRPEPQPCSVGTCFLSSRTPQTCPRQSPAGTPPASPSSPAARSWGSTSFSK